LLLLRALAAALGRYRRGCPGVVVVVWWQIRQIFSTVEIILATNKDLLEAPLIKRVEQQWC
jgi:hypothetical protein